ncbi:MAG: diacylglycerol kinase family protein [Clostridiales bacterium]|nr:diacylglycerol kinase family protein [Clostridiales bacterium]
MRFFKSFRYAFRGIVYCINNERNMRFHTVAALYVLVFSAFFGLSRAEYGVLFLTVAGVMAAEMFNTVAEELSDMAAASFHPVVRIIKDMAAGGVLICALFAAAAGVCLFWRPAAWGGIFQFFARNPAMLALLIVTAALSAVFVAMGPLGIRDFIIRKRRDR